MLGSAGVLSGVVVFEAFRKALGLGCCVLGLRLVGRMGGGE